MNLTPKELERLTIFNAAELARRRKARGVKLNHPEAVAYLSDWVCEGAREGASVATLREEATQLLAREDVMEGVPAMIDTIQVEPVFPDGTKLVTIHDPIRADSREQLDEVPTYDRRPIADGGTVADGESAGPRNRSTSDRGAFPEAGDDAPEDGCWAPTSVDPGGEPTVDYGRRRSAGPSGECGRGGDRS